MNTEYFLLSVTYPYGELMFVGPDSYATTAYYRAKKYQTFVDAKRDKDLLEHATKLKYQRYVEQVSNEASHPVYEASVLRFMENVNTSGIDVRAVRLTSEVVG